MVTLKTTVHDSGVSLLSNTLLCNLGINPVGVSPHLGANLSKLDGSGGVVADGVLEGLVEVSIVEEDIWIMIPSVEVSFNRLHRLDNTLQLLVSSKDDECAVHSLSRRVGLETSSDKYFVVLFADFSVDM